MIFRAIIPNFTFMRVSSWYWYMGRDRKFEKPPKTQYHLAPASRHSNYPKGRHPSIYKRLAPFAYRLKPQLSMGLISPMYGSRIDAISGNFITARPYGIRDGVDYQMTGEVRSIDVETIKTTLLHDHIVILGSMGYSATGEVFNLLVEDVALSAAVARRADKLIFLGERNWHQSQ